ncbi:MAG TPA: hypothetical protein VLE53_16090 [Gemmatimonadaceae bacterium]|nr:hypothetical protein [Gemmatimonadaceae bacterium]
MATSSATRETVFTVLASAARNRSTRSLWLQLSISLLLAVAIAIGAPQWWSLAALLGGPAAFAAWGLTVRAAALSPAESRLSRIVPLLLTAIGSGATLVGSVGLAMALFTGNAGGIKNACGPRATEPRCQAWANPPVVSRPVVP